MNDTEMPACVAFSLTGTSILTYRPWQTERSAAARELLLEIRFRDRSFAAPLFLHRDGIYLWACGDQGRLRAPIAEEELKYFYPNPEDYYYLPMEDEAIHKSVSSFVERSHRVQATVSNCYTRRRGDFLPVLASTGEKEGQASEIFPGYPDRIPVFRVSWRDHRRFIEYPGEQKEDMERYALHVLSWFLSGSRQEPVS